MSNLDSADVSQDQPHQANHQADTKSFFSSITSAQNDQSFEAATAVLDTNELLHMIIAEVPLMYRTSIRGVSKTWKTAVMKISHTVDPIGYTSWTRVADPEMPLYPNEPDFGCIGYRIPAFRINSVFDNTKFMINRFHGITGVGYYQFVPDISALAGHEHEFITDPPITQALINARRGGEENAILRVREGIRIGDLVHYFKKWPKRWGIERLDDNVL
jgi:hypothetical protein